MIEDKDYSMGEHADGEPNVRHTRISSRNRNLLIIVGTAVLLVVIALFLWPRHESANKKVNVAAESKEAEEDAKAGNEVVFSVNTGAGIEVGKPILTISNISTVWVIANVPEGQVNALRVGTPAEVRSAALGQNAIAGRVTYIDSALNEETRTGRVRVEIANPGERLKTGMFVEVGFQTGTTGTGTAESQELVIPDEAVQRIGDRSVVFVAKEGELGHFEVRDVQLGGAVEGYRRVLSGLALGDRVVTKGGFALKTQLMKKSLGEE